MQRSLNRPQNAVIAIRVSTTKQGTDGDSPEAQREQLLQYADRNGINVKETFVFLESGSKFEQPMQQAINYCKDPENDIQLFIIKSIDRFTRGGVNPYGQLKQQLDQLDISLIDIYGVISAHKVNTLDHLGIEYAWSKYSPSQKTEYLEAERAKDELRDILSRMIGAEVRYARLGYWMRMAPYGYESIKVETPNGKRCILRPHPIEAPLIVKIFELKAEGVLSDEEICERVNGLGFITRSRYRTVDGKRTLQGGSQLTPKAIWKIIRSPIYTGINSEKWTDYKPIKCVFDGLVDIETFNRANRGKFGFMKDGDTIQEFKDKLPINVLNNGKRSIDFPYRRFVGCSKCTRPLLGSASRGKNGKYYPAYHCSNHGHYFRVSKSELEESVKSLVSTLEPTEESIDALIESIAARVAQANKDALLVSERASEKVAVLERDIEATVMKMKLLESPTALKYMEEDLMKSEAKLQKAKRDQSSLSLGKTIDFEAVSSKVKYFLEHLEILLEKQIDPVKKAQLFGLLFTRIPTYAEINPGNQNSPEFLGVNSVLCETFRIKSRLVISRRIELRLPG